ncbi:MAG TPA: 30S ribosomal protein S10 [Clostridiales bacterium]|nr:30S ribosomal protein S10 [Clostridiales bacterium]
MEGRKIRLKVSGKEQDLVYETMERIIETVEKLGAKVSRPITLPTVKNLLAVTRSHKLTIEILNPTSKAVDALMRLEIPECIDIDFKL